MNITSFKKGDIVTRIEPSLAYCGFGNEKFGDRSYMGNKLEFIGIANNQIYFKSLEEIDIVIFGENHIRSVAIDVWSEGWDLYIDPKSLLSENQPIITLNRRQLEVALQNALDIEDYEKAEQIKNQLNNL